MKQIATIFLLMLSLTCVGQNGKASTEKKTFNRTTTITQTIEASPTVVWNLLTNAAAYSKWNSTIVSIEGKIEEGEKIKLVSTLDPERTFKLKVKECAPEQRLVWGDAMGKRVYTLVKEGDATVFSMTEKIGSFMFPLFANKIPSFDASFEQFVADLKQAAEAK